MTTPDDEWERVSKQEILPHLAPSVYAAPETWQLPSGFLGSGLLARSRYASEQKQFEAYTRLVAAKNVLIRMLSEQQGLIAEYVGLVERVRNLDILRLIARLKIQNELDEIESQGKLAKLRVEAEVARVEFERDHYRVQREQLNAPKTPPPASTPAPSVADHFRSAARRIDEIEQAYLEISKALISSAGGEENLPEALRNLLGQYGELRAKLIHDVMSELT